MANNTPPSDDFLDQILAFPNYSASAQQPISDAAAPPMMLHLAGGGYPLGLSLEQAKISGGYAIDAPATASGKPNLFLGEPIASSSSVQQMGFQPAAGPQPPPPATTTRPRVRARRGQATDPHSIAERLRRERIAERIRALQELVPTVNKTDRAAMVDEVVDYVKFLRLQVKLLSMSRLGGDTRGGTDMPSILEGENGGGCRRSEWERWSNEGTERQVAKLMEENVGAAMQFLQSRALCVVPISLASAICRAPEPETDPQS